jgi:triacylglycerol lipase
VKTLTNDADRTAAAKLGLLVMYAWDMCDKHLSSTCSDIDPRIAADGWNVIGIITGADDVITSGSSGIRQKRITANTNDRKRYGYVANKNIGDKVQYVAVVRGTDGAEEWFDDCVFVMKSPDDGIIDKGNVESGFFDIYKSLNYFPLNDPLKEISLIQCIKGIVKLDPNCGSVTVLGHSLGSAIATYLTYALALSLGKQVHALLFASPKTGDHDFVEAFDELVGNDNYMVVNYEHDLVPRVPPFDITQLDIYRALPVCQVITDENAKVQINNNDKACCHHLICYIAMLDPRVFESAKGTLGWTDDDKQCASCLTQKD